jgi:L,D-transpeptidase ErfK/SrfK
MIVIYLFLLFCGQQHIAAGNTPQAQIETDIAQLEKALTQHSEQNAYVVIDTQHNRLQIWQNGRIVHQATCATGSGKVLLHPKKQDLWQFTTPVGLWRVKRKVTDPIWAKPIWAFVENDDTIPILPWEFRRLDPTTLGAYALELGDGYEIHGTLYPTLLGRNITHGCIRLNDEDLARTYQLIDTGNRVYIY